MVLKIIFYFQMWDMRRLDRYEKQIIAVYNGFVFIVDWYLEERNLFVIGGRDKIIKVKNDYEYIYVIVV